MHERNLYAAHPINTYGTPLEAAYLRFLSETFPQADIIDPNSDEVKAAVKRIKDACCDESGNYSETLYNTNGAKKVMEYFTALVRVHAHAGAGLALPSTATGEASTYVLPAGIAKELLTIHENRHPIWVVIATSNEHVRFEVFPIKDVHLDFLHSDPLVAKDKEVKQEEVFMFVAEDGTVFRQLNIKQTRERIYMSLPDGSPDRKNLKLFFL